MSELLTAARPYAKAFYSTVANDNPERYLPVMQICYLLGANNKSKGFLSSRHLTVELLNETLSDIFLKVKVEKPKMFNNLLTILEKNKRFILLPEIASLFIKQLSQSNSVVLTEVVTAKELTQDNKDSLTKALEDKFSKKIDLTEKVDKSLLGGVIIKFGDSVIDTSIKGKLEQLSKALV